MYTCVHLYCSSQYTRMVFCTCTQELSFSERSWLLVSPLFQRWRCSVETHPLEGWSSRCGGECFLLRASGVACFTGGQRILWAGQPNSLFEVTLLWILWDSCCQSRIQVVSTKRLFPVAGLTVRDGSTAEASYCASYFYFTRILTMVVCCDRLTNLKRLQVATDLPRHHNHCVQLQHWNCCTIYKGFLLTYVAAQEINIRISNVCNVIQLYNTQDYKHNYAIIGHIYNYQMYLAIYSATGMHWCALHWLTYVAVPSTLGWNATKTTCGLNHVFIVLASCHLCSFLLWYKEVNTRQVE